LLTIYNCDNCEQMVQSTGGRAAGRWLRVVVFCRLWW